MIIERQRIALRVLQLRQGQATRLHLTKWLFLFGRLSKASSIKSFYRFVPYRFGPFSFALYHEMENLARFGLVSSEDRSWVLTDLGSRSAFKVPSGVERDLHIILDRYGHLSVHELIDAVYGEYPWYSLLSETIERRAATRPEVAPAVYTIGYEGVSIDEFANSLLHQGIRRLIDVRGNPVSRRYGFHKTTLARVAQNLEIDYRHFPELGISSSEREHARLDSDMLLLFSKYEHDLSCLHRDSIERVGSLMTDLGSALVCMEADADRCHRSYLAPLVAKHTGLPVVHLRVTE